MPKKHLIAKKQIFIRNIFFITLIFQSALIVLLGSLTYLNGTRKANESIRRTNLSSIWTLPGGIASKTGTGKVMGVTVTGGDARSLLLRQFILKYQPKSPFLPYTDLIVEMADKYGIDFRLVPAIGMCESNMGMRLPKKDAFNAWGIAVFTNDIMGKRFNDWDHAFEWVSKYIKERYYERGITSLYDIGAIWAPPSVANGYSWTKCVQSFMDKIE